MIEIIEDVRPAVKSSLGFVWLEITGRCQLECVHCYAESGPVGNHGTMTVTDWERIIDECADLGVAMVQFIGGEPTLHPDLPPLVEYALTRGLEVEVFTNLVHVSPTMWNTFDQPGVRLASSWYSTDPAQHLQIVRRNTHPRTKANLVEATRRGIPLRVGIIGMLDDQDLDAASAELVALGVTDVEVDHLRQVGRGTRDQEASMAQLCGNCGDGVIAVGPDGSVWPCVFSRWMPVGNVQDATLADILVGQPMQDVGAKLAEEFSPREMPCVPRMCNPQCGPSCSPACRPANNCRPVGACVPWYR